jgi:hypothetical protein
MKNIYKFIFLLFSFLGYSRINAQTANITDSLALVDMYNSMNGPYWLSQTGWPNSNLPVKSWSGVQLDNTGRVVSLLLQETDHIDGYLPASFGNLTALKKLNLEGAYIRNGSLPSFIANLTNLVSLSLGGCGLTGVIPSFIGDLSNLQVLDLAYNNFTPEQIPTELSKLSKLGSLSLYNDNLIGDIPASFANLTSLVTLHLQHNHLTGGLLALQNLPLSALQLYQNFFTFDGLETLASKFSFIDCAPQDTILVLNKTNNLFSVTAGGTLAKNTYDWYSPNGLQASKTGDSTFTPSPDKIDLAYWVVITNAIIPYANSGGRVKMTLRSNTFYRSDHPGNAIMAAKQNTKYASYEYTDPNGWTHYYYNNNTPDDLTDDTLLLSLKKNGHYIGTVGDGTFSLKLSATSGAGSNTGILLTNPLITNSSGYWVMNRYWEVKPTYQPSGDIGVRFYYNNQDLNDVNGSYPSHNLTNNKLIFYKTVGGNPDPTTNLSGATKIISIMLNASATDATWTYNKLSDTTQYAEYSVADFSGGGGGGGTGNNRALPVKLLSFTASPNQSNVVLKWETAEEINSSYYQVERSQTGSTFSTIGKIDAAGNTTTDQSYSFIDYNILNLNTGPLYYRLKMTDKNGQFSYSPVCRVNFDQKNLSMVVYPNPTNSIATLRFNVAQNSSGKYSVKISDITGKTIKIQEDLFMPGVNTTLLDLSGYEKGAYIITLNCAGIGNQSCKLIKN